MIRKIVQDVADELNIDPKVVRDIAKSMASFTEECITKGVPVRIKYFGAFNLSHGMIFFKRRTELYASATTFKECCLDGDKPLKGKVFAYCFLKDRHYDIVLSGNKCGVSDITDNGCLFSFPALIGVAQKINEVTEEWTLETFNMSKQEFINITKNNFGNGVVISIFAKEI